MSYMVWKEYMPLMDILMTISATLLLTISISFAIHKKLRAHPAVIVATLTCFESAYQYSILSRFLVCPGNLDVVFSYAVFGDAKTENLLKSMNILSKSWLFFYNFFFAEATMCDIAFQIDLMLTNLKPFQKPNFRVWVQLVLGFIFSSIFATVLLYTDFDYMAPINLTIFFTLKGIFFTGALFNLTYCAIAFTRTGLNKQHRNILFKRHLSFCILTSCCQTVALFNVLQVTGIWE